VGIAHLDEAEPSACGATLATISTGRKLFQLHVLPGGLRSFVLLYCFVRCVDFANALQPLTELALESRLVGS